MRCLQKGSIGWIPKVESTLGPMRASCGKVDPVFRTERCAASDKEHRAKKWETGSSPQAMRRQRIEHAFRFHRNACPQCEKGPHRVKAFHDTKSLI